MLNSELLTPDFSEVSEDLFRRNEQGCIKLTESNYKDMISVLNNALCRVNWNVNYHMKSTFKSDCLCLSMHSIALLWPVEWEVISRMFLVDQAISIHQVHDKTQDNGNVQYQICPGELNRQPSARSFSKPESFSKSCENVCCPLRSVSGMQRGLHIPAAEGHDGVRAGHCVCSQNHWQEKGEFLHDPRFNPNHYECITRNN